MAREHAEPPASIVGDRDPALGVVRCHRPGRFLSPAFWAVRAAKAALGDARTPRFIQAAPEHIAR